jgi:hypothetical protein
LGLVLRGFRTRRLYRRLARAEAERLAPVLAQARDEIDAAAAIVREENMEALGFPPTCPACGRGMVAHRHQLSKKRWRWEWTCRGPRCWSTLPYRKLKVETPTLDV